MPLLRLTPRYLGPLDDKIKIAKELTIGWLTGLGGVSPTRWCGSFEPVLDKIFAIYYFQLEAFG